MIAARSQVKNVQERVLQTNLHLILFSLSNTSSVSVSQFYTFFFFYDYFEFTIQVLILHFKHTAYSKYCEYMYSYMHTGLEYGCMLLFLFRLEKPTELIRKQPNFYPPAQTNLCPQNRSPNHLPTHTHCEKLR